MHVVFGQLLEYVSKDSLDMLLCLAARADVTAGTLRLKLSGDVGADATCSSSGSGNGGSSSGNGSVHGGSAGSSAGAGANGSGASGANGSGSGAVQWPVYLINDINLMTVVDSVRLLLAE